MWRVGVLHGVGWWRRGPGLAALTLGLPLGCGRTVDTAGSASVLDVGSGADQSRVPPGLVKPGISRYFMVDDATTGPEMVMFEDPAAPRVVGLGYPGGSYEAARTAWSPSGRRFAYALTATRVGVTPPNHLMLADAADDFAPREVTHEYLDDYADSITWLGERAVLVVTGWRSAAAEGGSQGGRYSLIDADTGDVADLGELPPVSPDGMSRGPDAAAVWAGQSGALYLDQSCTVTLIDRQLLQNPLFRDCSARAEWSGDDSFVLISTDTERAFYAMAMVRTLAPHPPHPPCCPGPRRTSAGLPMRRAS